MKTKYPLFWQGDLGEKECMERSLQFYRPRMVVWNEIEKAYSDETWDWDKKSDGCSGVGENYYPRKFRHPVCVAHDWGYEMVRRGLAVRREKDKLLLQGMLDYRFPLIKAFVWYGFIRVFGSLVVMRDKQNIGGSKLNESRNCKT